ncbi:MAG: (Fe-S)-binding protein [Candidatus Lokiarchaeota archaeon]|nr:(Fe-S)-binding protein [Candidatus Lokiarchaeota archaeon]
MDGLKEIEGENIMMKKVRYIKGLGIEKIASTQEDHVIDRHQGIEHYKDIIYQCGKCGTCRTVFQDVNWARVCPSGELGKFEAYYLGGKNLLIWGLTSGKLKWTDNLAKIFYKCSLCLACTQQCQIPELHTYAGEWLMAMREDAVQNGFGPMLEQKQYAQYIDDLHNPYGEQHENRRAWFPSEITQNTSSKLAYFVGCTASYRENDIAVSTVKILNSLNIDFRILENESCCGSPVFMTGQTDKAKELAVSNVEMFKDEKIEKIITSCAGCYRALKEIYPKKFELKHGIEIIHLPEFISIKLKNGSLKFNNNINMKVTYHDPCHIGRHMGLYKEPRTVLENISGLELVEMDRNMHNAWCCGSGGGVRSAFKDLSEFSARERIDEALETNATAIVSSCPFCLNQFKTNIKNEEISVYDISQLIEKAI